MLLVFLLQVSLLLLVALALGRLAVRVGLPALVGELLTGVLLGPSLLGTLTPGLMSWVLPADVDQLHLLDAVGDLGAGRRAERPEEGGDRAPLRGSLACSRTSARRGGTLRQHEGRPIGDLRTKGAA